MYDFNRNVLNSRERERERGNVEAEEEAEEKKKKTNSSCCFYHMKYLNPIKFSNHFTYKGNNFKLFRACVCACLSACA